jgi:transportin-3
MDAGEALDLHGQLSAAVHALNSSAQPSTRLAANQWLLGLQRSPQAWALAASLLTSGDHSAPSADLLFFAAQMLRRKIQSPGDPLPDPAAQLLDALLVAARRFCFGPPRLLTQICLALAALALRAEGGVDGLFARMPHLPDPALLELLTVLPEEVAQDQSGDTGIDSASRCRYTRELLAHASAVLEFLFAESEKPDAADGVPFHERSRRILRCLLSWVRMCFARLLALSSIAFVFCSLCAKSDDNVAGPRGMLFRNTRGRCRRAPTSHVRVQLPAGVDQ